MTGRDTIRHRRGNLRLFTVAYYGKGNRFILSETRRAYSVENANERAERAMPPGAVTYEVTDDFAGGH